MNLLTIAGLRRVFANNGDHERRPGQSNKDYLRRLEYRWQVWRDTTGNPFRVTCESRKFNYET